MREGNVTGNHRLHLKHHAKTAKLQRGLARRSKADTIIATAIETGVPALAETRISSIDPAPCDEAPDVGEGKAGFSKLGSSTQPEPSKFIIESSSEPLLRADPGH